ncbi:MAG TPA: phospholipase D-like domain-containing protein [Chthoniobacteraceae bacterium]
MLPFRREPPSPWPALLTGAVVGATAGVLISGNFFTEGKKIRKPITTDYHVGDGAFIRTMGQLLGPPLLDGNRVEALQNGAEIFPAMLQAIAAAECSICFENFIYWKGRVAMQFAEALAERARAGVKVHFLQDALGCDCHHGEEMDLMKEAGVQLHLYRFTHVTRINQRTHRKLLIVDGKVGFTGGVGIADKWDGHGDGPEHWRDSHYCLRGPAVAQMQQAFMDNWIMAEGELLHGDEYFPELEVVGDDMCQIFKSSADEGSDSARIMVIVSIAAAQHHVRIGNAYFIPDDLTIQTLVDARKRGVEVEIIVPGERIDQPWVRWLSRARWKPLLEAGVRIYEFQPTNFHCKYLMADSCWVSVGSTNLDNRSLRLNEECNLNVLDKEFAAEHLQIFENDKAQSREVTLSEWRQRPLAEKLAGNAARLLRGQM